MVMSFAPFALHVAADDGVALLKDAEKLGARHAAATGEALATVALKGRPGVRWLSTPAARALFRPHPLIGLAKGLWKGNLSTLIQRALDAAGPKAWWLVPLLAAWVVVELGLLAANFTGVRQADQAPRATTRPVPA